MSPTAARHALAALLVVAGFALAVIQVQDTDAWTHLALGREIVRAGALPAHEPFNFPSLGLPYRDPEWLFDLVIYVAWAAAGIPGVVLLKASIIAVAALILLRDALTPPDPPERHSLGLAVSVGVVFSSLVMLRHRFVERPDLVMIVFVAFTAYALNAYVWHGRRAIYGLPVLQVLWVNMHPSVVVGVLPFVAVLVGGGLQQALGRRWGIELPGTPAPRQLRTIARVFGLVLLASTANPNGFEPFLVPFRLATSTWLKQEIVELQAPRWNEYASPFVIAALLVLVFVLSIRRLSIVSVLLVTPFVCLGLSARRFVVLLAVVSAPVLARHLRWLMGRVGWVWLPQLALPAGLLAAVAVVTVTGLTLGRVEPFVDPDQIPGLGVNQEPLPEGALRYLDRARIPGRVFNTFQWGGYIAWRDFPSRAAFVDGRGHLPPGLLDDMISARAAPERLADLSRRYAFDMAILDYPRDTSPLRDATPDLDFGLTSRDWALVYWDDVALVYVRRTPALASLIERDEYREVKPANGTLALRPKLADPRRRAVIETELERNIAETGSSTALAFAGFVHNEAGASERAIETLSRVRQSPPSPNLRAAYQGLAFAHGRLGRTAEEVRYYRKAVQLGEDPLILLNLGLALGRAGDDRATVRALERAHDLDGRLAPVYPALITAYRRTGRFDRAQKLETEYPTVLAYSQAEEHFRRAMKLYFERRYEEAVTEFKVAVALNPRSATVLSNLGWVYFDVGLIDQAFAQQKAALDVDPRFANAHYGLALIYRRRGEYANAREHLAEYLQLEPAGYWSRRAAEELNRLPSR